MGAIDDEALALAADLVDTMRASPACVGLAATQIGVPLRVFVIDVTGHPKAPSPNHGLVVLFDPVLLASDAPVIGREGCMSVPDLTGDVARPAALVVQGTTPSGRQQSFRAVGFEARAVLHELDHLDGMLFLDRVTSASGVFRRKVYR